MKRSGVYHEMFSTGDVVVPEHVADPASLKVSVPMWMEWTIKDIFDDDGKPIRIFGKALMSSPDTFRDLVHNALARILNCVPPDGIDAWRSSGEKDHNGFEIMKPNFHTCGCEMINAMQTAFCVGDNTSSERATACHYEGNARLIQVSQPLTCAALLAPPTALTCAARLLCRGSKSVWVRSSASDTISHRLRSKSIGLRAMARVAICHRWSMRGRITSQRRHQLTRRRSVCRTLAPSIAAAASGLSSTLRVHRRWWIINGH